MIRATISFGGHVQGVGFRYTARGLAGDFELAGYVKNLADGRVELVIEGAAAEVDRYVAAVEEAMKGFIRSRTIDRSPANGEFGAPARGALGIRH